MICCLVSRLIHCELNKPNEPYKQNVQNERDERMSRKSSNLHGLKHDYELEPGLELKKGFSLETYF